MTKRELFKKIIEDNTMNKDEMRAEILAKAKFPERKKKIRLKRAVIIAAIMSIMLFLTGAAVVYYYEMVYFDMSGNRVDKDIPFYSPRHEVGSEAWEFEMELFLSMNAHEALFITPVGNLGERMMTNAPENIEDYDELINYIKNNGGEAFGFPEYMPEGFEFSFGRVYRELWDYSMYKDRGLESSYYMENFGYIYEIYALPEEERTINWIALYYYKGDIYICLMAQFWYGEFVDSMIFGRSASVMAEPEIIEIEQFERSLIIGFRNARLNPNPMWELKLVKPIDDDPFGLSRSIIYTIDSTSTFFSGVSRRDIIKMAESIK